MFGLFKSLLGGNDNSAKPPILIKKYNGVSFDAPEHFLVFLDADTDNFSKSVDEVYDEDRFRALLAQLSKCTKYEVRNLTNLVIKLQDAMSRIAYNYGYMGISFLKNDEEDDMFGKYTIVISEYDIRAFSEAYECLSLLLDNVDKFKMVSETAGRIADYIAYLGFDLRRMMESMTISALSEKHKNELGKYITNWESSINLDLYNDDLLDILL